MGGGLKARELSAERWALFSAFRNSTLPKHHPIDAPPDLPTSRAVGTACL
ncbi:MAG: hypothetical protein WD098_05030 [Balneolales bacterium]